MKILNSRRLLTAGLMLTLALPSSALAHRGHNHHGFGHFRQRAVPCHALEAGRTPARFTADQVTALKTACTARDAAIKQANDTFKSDTASALATYKATVAPLKADLKSARDARRSACRTDRTSQACADAKTAFRTALQTDLPKLRAAFHAYKQAVRPAEKTRNQAIVAALKAFRQAVKAALAS
jgi:hypothetical protein